MPGTADTGSHGDDTDTLVTLPFPFTLYGTSYNSVRVSSNGRLDFVVANESGGYVTACLPPPPNIGPYDNTISAVGGSADRCGSERLLGFSGWNVRCFHLGLRCSA